MVTKVVTAKPRLAVANDGACWSIARTSAKRSAFRKAARHLRTERRGVHRVDEVAPEAHVAKEARLSLYGLHDKKFGRASTWKLCHPDFCEVRTELAEENVAGLEGVT